MKNLSIKYLVKYFLIMGFFCFPSIALAVDGAADFKPPGTTPPAPTDKLKLDGYISGSYNYLFKKNYFTSDVFNRLYDLNENGLTLQQIYLLLSKQPKEGFGGVLNVLLGHDALISAPFGLNPTTGIHNFGWDIQECYLQYVKGPETLRGGFYQSLAGAEPVDEREMSSFSYGILSSYAVPGFVLGLRSITDVTKKLLLITGVNNGWDVIRDTGRQKTIELGLAYTGTKFSFSIQGYTGDQRAEDYTAHGPIGRRNVIDFIATYEVTPKFSVDINLDYGRQNTAALPIPNEEENINHIILETLESLQREEEMNSEEMNSGEMIPPEPQEEMIQFPPEEIIESSDFVFGNAIWKGIASHINYKFNDKWRISLRAEDFDDQDGYRTGVVQNWKEVTLTLGYFVIKKLELRFEARRDFSNVNSFLNKDKVTTSNFQQSYAVEGVYSL